MDATPSAQCFAQGASYYWKFNLTNSQCFSVVCCFSVSFSVYIGLFLVAFIEPLKSKKTTKNHWISISHWFLKCDFFVVFIVSVVIRPLHLYYLISVDKWIKRINLPIPPSNQIQRIDKKNANHQFRNITTYAASDVICHLFKRKKKKTKKHTS